MASKDKDKVIFWDYDIDKVDLSKPENKKWYLSRKINFGDFSNIKFSDLKENLNELDISPSLKELVRNFLQQYAKKANIK